MPPTDQDPTRLTRGERIVKRYAVPQPGNDEYWMQCQPDPGEVPSARLSGNDGKPVYATPEAAQRAARKLARLGGIAAQAPYQCERIGPLTEPHYHLSVQKRGGAR